MLRCTSTRFLVHDGGKVYRYMAVLCYGIPDTWSMIVIKVYRYMAVLRYGIAEVYQIS